MEHDKSVHDMDLNELRAFHRQVMRNVLEKKRETKATIDMLEAQVLSLLSKNVKMKAQIEEFELKNQEQREALLRLNK